jgi:hypothetical protein
VIQDIDRTLEKILVERGKLNRNEIEVSFEQPTSEWSSKLSRPTLNCWTYDLRENLKLRSFEMTITRNEKTGKHSLPPLRYNVSYLVTAWARRIEDEHQLLSRALAALAGQTAWQPEDCEGLLKEQAYEIPVLVAQPLDNGVNMTDLWSVLNNDMRLGFTLMVTVALDIERAVEAPLVLEGTVRIGDSPYPPGHELSMFEELHIGQPEKTKKAKEGKKR